MRVARRGLGRRRFHCGGVVVRDKRAFGARGVVRIRICPSLEFARRVLGIRIRRACSLLSGPLVFAFAVAAFAWVWRKYRS